MKIIKILLCLFLLIALADFTSGQVRDKRNRILPDVTATTMTWTMGGGYLPGRVYYHVENQSASYDVKRISWNADSSINGKILRAPDGWWEDKYNVYQSSWWYRIVGDGPANVAAYNAIIVIHERD